MSQSCFPKQCLSVPRHWAGCERRVIPSQASRIHEGRPGREERWGRGGGWWQESVNSTLSEKREVWGGGPWGGQGKIEVWREGEWLQDRLRVAASQGTGCDALNGAKSKTLRVNMHLVSGAQEYFLDQVPGAFPFRVTVLRYNGGSLRFQSLQLHPAPHPSWVTGFLNSIRQGCVSGSSQC